MTRLLLLHTIGAGVVLAAIAIAAPQPSFATDRDIYEQMSRQWVVPDCDDLQCFRPLVSWVLGLVPGDGYAKWRAYAVVCEAAGALAMALWVLRTGASMHAAVIVLWLTALGTGSLYTLYDPFTSDPLMHLLGPLLMTLLVDGRLWTATAIAGAGILAKEFAAVPMFVHALMRVFRLDFRRFDDVMLSLGMVIAVWTSWGVVSRAAFNYTASKSHSFDRLGQGGFFGFWLEHIGVSLALVAIGGALAGLWLLWPAGVLRGPSMVRQLSAAAIVPFLVFNYVQQPDRAIWNFAFAIMPAVAVLIDRAPRVLAWGLVCAQALVGARMGAQLPAPPARLSLVVAMLVAGAMIHQSRQPQVRMAA